MLDGVFLEEDHKERYRHEEAGETTSTITTTRSNATAPLPPPSSMAPVTYIGLFELPPNLVSAYLVYMI